MKQYIVYLTFCTLSFLFVSFVPIPDEYDVEEIYHVSAPKKSGTMAILESGEIGDVEKLLIPTTLKAQRYRISVTEVSSDLYEIDGTDLYLKTSLCSEPATMDDATLIWESDYGMFKGRLVFDE